jgi:hypothetical protein
LRLKFKTVTGYQSGAEIDLAVERGDMHCRAFDLGGFGRPMVAPPELPPDVARALRDAYGKMLKDPDFGEVRKRQYDLDPVSDEEMQSMAREVVNQPADVIEPVRKLLEN